MTNWTNWWINRSTSSSTDSIFDHYNPQPIFNSIMDGVRKKTEVFPEVKEKQYNNELYARINGNDLSSTEIKCGLSTNMLNMKGGTYKASSINFHSGTVTLSTLFHGYRFSLNDVEIFRQKEPEEPYIMMFNIKNLVGAI